VTKGFRFGLPYLVTPDGDLPTLSTVIAARRGATGLFPWREHAGRVVSAESHFNITIIVTKFL
jgi:hypothetical protein